MNGVTAHQSLKVGDDVATHEVEDAETSERIRRRNQLASLLDQAGLIVPSDSRAFSRVRREGVESGLGGKRVDEAAHRIGAVLSL